MGGKIQTSIADLVIALSRCTPHYIRCIKPNENKQAGGFDNGLVQHQVRYLALLENVRVRRAGYAYRQFYEKFYFRYRACSSRVYPKFNGDYKEAAKCILEDSHMPKEEYDFGITKIFIRHPETVFSLEETRERKLYDYAVRIQGFFDLFVGSNNFFYQLRLQGNQIMKGKKERRRKSLDRAYRSDYIAFKDNNTLAAIVERYGNEGIEFGDTIFTFDYQFKPHRRIVLLTNEAIYILGIVPKFPPQPDGKKKKSAQPLNPDLIEKWFYGLHRRIALNEIRSISLSQLADDYVCIHVLNQHDSFISCKSKTEFFAVLQKQKQIQLNFSNTIQVSVKAKKKKKATMTTVNVNFEKGAGPKEPQPHPQQKNVWTVQVLPGEPPDTQPVIEQRKMHVQKQQVQIHRRSTNNNIPAAAPRGAPDRSSSFGGGQRGGPPQRGGPGGPQRGGPHPVSQRGRGAPIGGPGGPPRGRGAPRSRP